MKRPLVVLHVARLFLSGQTTHVVHTGCDMARQGHRVAVAAVGRSHDDAWHGYKATMRQSGVAAVRCPTVEKARVFWKIFSPDVVHVHSSDMVDWAVTTGEATGVPVIVTCHGLGVGRKSRLIRRAHWIIAVGKRVKRDLIETGLSHIDVIQNGVDIQTFRPRPDEEKDAPETALTRLHVSYVGRIDRGKKPGLMELVRAVRLMPRAKMHIASNIHLNMPGITSYGWLPDPAELMRRSDIVAGTGRTVREAMASGAIALVLGDAYGGIVTPSSFSKRRDDNHLRYADFSAASGLRPHYQDIRADIVKTVQNPKDASSLKVWGRDTARQYFCLSESVRKMIAVYRRVIGDDADRQRGQIGKVATETGVVP